MSVVDLGVVADLGGYREGIAPSLQPQGIATKLNVAIDIKCTI